jgi:hypothetical protein
MSATLLATTRLTLLRSAAFFHSSFSVEQHGGDFAPAHAFLFAIERAD